MKIVFTGPKCSGKTTAGKAFAKKIRLPFFETDTLIEKLYLKRTGKKLSCRDIYSEIGEDGFRTFEREIIQNIAEQDWCVISTGGSAMLNNLSRQLLRENSILILLYASDRVLLNRLKKTGIPAFLNGPVAKLKKSFVARIRTIIEVIKPYADIVIDSSALTPQKTLDTVFDGIRREIEIRSTNPNTFGHIVRLTTFGESHGPVVGAVLDGVHPGIDISEQDIQKELDRRSPGQSNITTSRKERDKIKILSGIFEGKTTGTPIGMIIKNSGQNSFAYQDIRDVFRPGTADFTFWKKYGIRDYRGGGRASGRETAGRVMAGAIAKKILKNNRVSIFAHTVMIADIKAKRCVYEDIEKNFVRCADIDKAQEMKALILKIKKNKDSIGGIVQLDILGVPPGLGDPVFGKLNAKLGMAFFSIGAVKGIEFGAGFSVANKLGSENNDLMSDSKFLTNNAGGILGGISTGEKIVVRIAIKPTPSIAKKQLTSKINNTNTELEIEGRHDPCILPRIMPVIESMAALVILDAWKLQERINPNWNFKLK